MVLLCTFVLRVAPKNTWSVCFQCSLTEFCRRQYVPEKVTLSIGSGWPRESSWQKGLLRTASYFRLSCHPDSLLYFILTETAGMSSLEDRLQTDTASPCKIPGRRNWCAVTPNTKSHFCQWTFLSVFSCFALKLCSYSNGQVLWHTYYFFY